MQSQRFPMSGRIALGVSLICCILATRLSAQSMAPRPQGSARRPANSYDIAMAELRAAYAATGSATPNGPSVDPRYAQRAVTWNPYAGDRVTRTGYALQPADYPPALSPYHQPSPTGYGPGYAPAPMYASPKYQTPAVVPLPVSDASVAPAWPVNTPAWPVNMPPAGPAYCPSTGGGAYGPAYQPVGYYQPVYAGMPNGPVAQDPYQHPSSKYYVGENLFGQPKLFVNGQPVRNALRSILP